MSKKPIVTKMVSLEQTVDSLHTKQVQVRIICRSLLKLDFWPLDKLLSNLYVPLKAHCSTSTLWMVFAVRGSEGSVQRISRALDEKNNSERAVGVIHNSPQTKS